MYWSFLNDFLHINFILKGLQVSFFRIVRQLRFLSHFIRNGAGAFQIRNIRRKEA